MFLDLQRRSRCFSTLQHSFPKGILSKFGDCSRFLTFKLLPVVVVPDHMEPLEPPLEAGPDPGQVLDEVITRV